MSSFHANRAVEAKSLLAVRDYLVKRGYVAVSTDGGDASKTIQKTLGDILVNDPAGRLFSIEVKAESTERPNLFLEVWSNRNLEDPKSHAGRGSTPGWMYTCGADFLFYHFLNTGKLVICKMFPLKYWAFCSPSLRISEPATRTQPPGRIWDFAETKQTRHEQLNDTHGRLVPIEVLQRELNPPAEVRFLPPISEYASVEFVT